MTKDRFEGFMNGLVEPVDVPMQELHATLNGRGFLCQAIASNLKEL
jgi:hypothetical protein